MGGKASFDLLHLELETCPDRCFTALSIWASKCRWHPYCFHFLSQPINNTWQLGQKHMLFSLIVTFWLIRTPQVIIQPWECDLVVFWNYDCSTEWTIHKFQPENFISLSIYCNWVYWPKWSNSLKCEAKSAFRVDGMDGSIMLWFKGSWHGMLLNTNMPREGNTHLFSFANTELENLHN